MKKRKEIFIVIFLIISSVFLIPFLSAVSISSFNSIITNTSADFSVSFSEAVNITVNYGTSQSLGSSLSNTDYSTSFNFQISSLIPDTTYYYNAVFCNNLNDCNSTGLLIFTTLASDADLIYPVFSNYLDNNGSLIDSGTVIASVIVTNTNGSVILNFGGQNFIATNNSGDPTRFNVSLFAGAGGLYTYYWKAYGDGTNKNYNSSGNRRYTINISSNPVSYPMINLISPVNNLKLNYSQIIFFMFNVTSSNPIANCSLILNGNISSTDTTITRNITQSISYNLQDTFYSWQINCTDVSNNKGSSSIYTLRVNSTSGNYSNPIAPNNLTNSSNQNETGDVLEGNVPYSIIQNISIIVPNNLTFTGDIDPLFGVIGLYINLNAEARDVQLFITRFDQKPDEVSNPENNNVYKYFEMHSDILTDKLDYVNVNFNVPKTWATQRDLDKEEISLFHFNSSSLKWDEVSTSVLREEGNYYIYTAKINSFSYFYIGQGTSEEQSLPPNAFLTFLKNNFFWIIAGVLILVSIFVLIQWIVTFKKRKNQCSEINSPELKPWAQGFSSETPVPSLEENESSGNRAPSFDENWPSEDASLNEEEKRKNNNHKENSLGDYISPESEEKPSETHEDMEKEIYGLRNQISDKEKKYSFSDKKE